MEKKLSSRERKITIKKIREITQYGKEKEVWRVFSPYFTYFAIKIHLSANQVTFIGLLFKIIGGTLFIISGFKYWFVGAFISLIGGILDYSDGEVARFKKEESKEGNFLDSILSSALPNAFLFMSVSIGLYRELDNVAPLILGLSALALLYINKNIGFSNPQHNMPLVLTYKNKNTGVKFVKQFIQQILDESMRIMLLLIAVSVDYIITNLSGKNLNWFINFRLFWLGFYVIVFLIGTITRFQETRKILREVK